MNANKHKQSIIAKAQELGFFYCGFSEAGFLEDEVPRLENWLKNNHHGKMSYMENHFDKRLDPRKLVPGAKSVISLLFNYATNAKQKDSNAPKISKYAFGEDYHYIVKERLSQLFDFLNETIGTIEGRAFVDSAPVLDKAWAAQSGLGWIGKHTNLITKDFGTWVFLGEIVTDFELDYDKVFSTNLCGSCTACIDLCPTEALEEYVLDANKCISYLTIEHRGEIDKSYQNNLNDWIYGCDICQEVCPWNKFSIQHSEPWFNANPKVLNMKKNEWEELSEEVFQDFFKKTALKRTKYKGLKRNIKFLAD